MKSASLFQPLPLLLGLLLVLVAVTALAYWNAQREAAASFDGFTTEQATLAATVAAAVTAAPPASVPSPPWLAELHTEARVVERSGQRLLLLRPPGSARFYNLQGQPLHAPEITAADERGLARVRLERPAAVALGLPVRRAAAGISHFAAPPCGLPAPCVGAGTDRVAQWTLAVVATAQRERDREEREVRQLLLWVLVSMGVLLTLGVVALRLQREALRRAQRLAISAAMEEANERLGRAEKAAMLGALATGITHEIATPLGVIVVRAEQLEPRVAGDEVAVRAVHAILGQVQDIERVIRGFLALARGSAPQFAIVDPAQVVAGAMELCEHRFARAGVKLAADVVKDLPRLRGDPLLLRQVLVNLLINACDACLTGGSAELRVTSAEGSLLFVVSDDGSTITAEAAARATEPFFTTKPAGQGTGLGLAIAFEIIKHHGGALTLRPRSGGRGTEARVELPALAQDAEEDRHGSGQS